MKVFGMCVNLKVVAVLAVAGVALWAVAPAPVAAALPLLVMLACPVSMLLMMRSMGRTTGSQEGSRTSHPGAEDAAGPGLGDAGDRDRGVVMAAGERR